MDSIGHTALALGMTVLMEYVFDLPFGSEWTLLLYIVALTVVPDIDAISLVFPVPSKLLTHRGITHTFAASAATSVFLPAFFWTRADYLVMVLFTFVLTNLHLVVDMLGTWSFSPFWPFDDRETKADLIKDFGLVECVIGIVTVSLYFVDEQLMLIGVAVQVANLLVRWLIKFLMVRKHRLNLIPTMLPWKWWGVIAVQHEDRYNEVSYFPLSLRDKVLPPKRIWLSTYINQKGTRLPMSGPLDAVSYILEKLEPRWGFRMNFPMFRLISEDPVEFFWYYVETIYWKYAWGMEVKIDANGELSGSMRWRTINKAPGLLLEGASEEHVIPQRFEREAAVDSEAGSGSDLSAMLSSVVSDYAVTPSSDVADASEMEAPSSFAEAYNQEMQTDGASDEVSDAPSEATTTAAAAAAAAAEETGEDTGKDKKKRDFFG